MKRVTLWSGGKLIGAWRANEVSFYEGACSFYDADAPKLDLVKISGTIITENVHEDKHGKAKE